MVSKEANVYKQIEAMIIADMLASCDVEMLQLVAEKLVRTHGHQKADSLQFALNVEIHENLVAHGFTNHEFVA